MERRIHPTIRPYVTILAIIAIIVALSTLALSSYFNDHSIAILIGGAIVIILLFLWIVRYWYDQLSTEYVIRDEEMVELTGIWAKDEEHVPLDKIQDFNVYRTLMQTLFGMASIGIQTAAKEKGYNEIVFKNLSKGDSDWLIGFLGDNIDKKGGDSA